MGAVLLPGRDPSWSFEACARLVQRFACPGIWRFERLLPMYLLHGRDRIVRSDCAWRKP
jgi:hypothetical protein